MEVQGLFRDENRVALDATDLPTHPRGRTCPALNKHCNACREIGHFAVTCRRKRVHMVQQKEIQSAPPAWSDDEADNKQVLTN